MDVQRTIESAVEKRTKDLYGPPPGKKLIIFIDDMNMPLVDTYGTQQPIALLKLLFERGGLYDRGKDLNWKVLRDICESDNITIMSADLSANFSLTIYLRLFSCHGKSWRW